MPNNDDTKPSQAEIDRLVEQVDRLVLPQANVFLREFLRDLDLKPQPNKAASRVQFLAAIEEGVLTQEGIDRWLRSVEGWGNQHVYAYGLPASIAAAAAWRTDTDIAGIVEAAHAGVWRASTGTSYPDDATLTRIDYDADRGVFSVEWHERTDSKAREKAMDTWPREMLPDHVHPESIDAEETDLMHNAMLIDGDSYWFNAFRLLPSRSVMRFAILLKPDVIDRPIAALFLRTAIGNRKHAQAVERAWNDLSQITVGRLPLDRIRNTPWSISTVIKRLDTDVARDQTDRFKSKKTRFSEGLAELEFTAPPDFTLPEVIGEVRMSIPQSAIDSDDFVGSEGDFRMEADPNRPTSRQARLQLIQAQNRIRIWTELDEPDVWTILETLDGYR